MALLSALIITFREGLEIALIVGIILAFLRKTHHKKYDTLVWWALASALLASGLFALVYTIVAGEFVGTAEMVFEGTTMLVAAILLVSMILWMMRHRVKQELEHKATEELSGRHKRGIFFLVFFSVLREGVETVLFLAAAITAGSILLGAILGALCAVVLGYLIFTASLRVNLRKFFAVTGIILVLFACGLVAKAAMEYQEAKILPGGDAIAWNINPAPNVDGTYPFWHEEGTGGGIVRDLFGPWGAPSILAVIMYFSTLVVIGGLWRYAFRRRE